MVAAIEAHASEYARSLTGAEAFYEDPSASFDVTHGSNGHCTPPDEDSYFCRAQLGYDGPTGVGTPDGPLTLSSSGAPIAMSRPASDVSTGDATLNGAVEPNGLPASYHFEYGPTTGYGTSAPVPDASVGTSGQAVGQTITGLTPNTVYHYRLVATSNAGTSYGEDVVFTTGAPSVTAVGPDSGPDRGETSVTITGTNFAGVSAVRFGSTEAESFSVESEDSITAVSPPGTGPVDVTVESPAGRSASVPGDRFGYEKVGPVLAWGSNDGMLGDGQTAKAPVPVEVEGLPEASALATGLSQSLAVVKGGTVMGWGEDAFGTIGDGGHGSELVPVGVCAVGVSECANGPYLEEAMAVAAGGVQSLALLKNGTVVAWGFNSGGALGADVGSSAVPVPVCTKLEAPCKPENYLREVKAIAAGVLFSMALLDDGTVVAWGQDYAGQLGNGNTSGPETCGEEKTGCSRVPIAVPGLAHVSAIAAGWASALALLEDGAVMSWGENEVGELGDATRTNASSPADVCAVGDTKHPCAAALGGAVAITAGDANGYAVLKGGSVVAWGANEFAQLGDGSTTGPKECAVREEGESEKFACSLSPVSVEHLSEVSAIASSPVGSSVLARLDSGELESWGYGGSGVLGDDIAKDSAIPVGVCEAYAQAPCPKGPHLGGEVTAMAAGQSDLVSFASAPGPALTSVTPQTGPASGGTEVTIIGAGFSGATAVDFGGSEATDVQIVGPDELTAVSPPGTGSVDVSVSTPEGVSPASEGAHFTYQGAPTVSTDQASAVGATAATLNGAVNPGGEALSDCHFEYGTTPAFGTSVPCATLPGSGTSSVPVSDSPIGLEAGTTYYFRAVATNESGTSYGSAQSFTTSMLPELGRCVKLPHKTGAFTSRRCTTQSAGADSGRYEWLEGATTANHFNASGAATTFELEDGLSLECSASSLTGEYTGSHTAAVALSLTGCKLILFGALPCHSAGAVGGEIKGEAVEAQLGMIEAGALPRVAWVLNPYSSAPLATLECEGISKPFVLAGSVIGSVKKVDKMSSSFTLTFTAGAHGLQSPERLEDGLADTLSLVAEEPIFTGGDEAALEASEVVSGEEAVEIKAIA